MSLDFTISTPTDAIGAATPSRAISFTLSGTGTLGSGASIALDDASFGGTFFPASPLTIAGGSGAGAAIQCCYIAPSGATGSVTITGSCTGGLTATHSITLQIAANASVFLRDSFSGSGGTDLGSHTPDSGGSWTKQTIGGNDNGNFLLTGSGAVYDSIAGTSAAIYVASATAATAEFDASADFVVEDTTTLCAPLISLNPTSGETSVNGYTLQIYNNAAGGIGWYAYVFNASTPTTLFSAVGTPSISPGTYHATVAARSVNGSQYLFFVVDGVLVSGTAYQDSTFTSKLVAIGPETVSPSTQSATTGVLMANLYGRNVDWFATYTLAGGAGTFAETGGAAGLLHDRLLAGGSGTFAESGSSAGLLHDRVLPASAGSFSETGGAAALLYGRLLAGGTGAFSETGDAASLLYSGANAVLAGGTGAFVETGSTAGLLVGHLLAGGTGTFTEAGGSAALLYGRMLAGASGTFAETGSTAGLLHDRLLAGGTGAYIETGDAASLIYSGASPVLAGGTGAFVVAGSSAALLHNRVLPAAAGSYAEAGGTAGLCRGLRLGGGTGAFAETGGAAGLLHDRLLAGGAGSYAETGGAASLFVTGPVARTHPDPGQSTGTRIGVDLRWSTGMRIGPDPRQSTGVRA